MFRIIAVIFALVAMAFAAPGYIEPSYGVVPVAHVVPVVKHIPVVKQVPVVHHVPVVKHVSVVKHVPVVQHVPVLKSYEVASYGVPTYGHQIYHG
ncbi:uncharacterized protein LOC119552717 isoform X1 [Drosophila subpulchrella]|uniref:uncharacterized protein LOC119552717 isoform X1 n=1 Tax=Drosophila subpulchrella TaxID=1486046 RepID=UPI0018A1A5E0|nr:uncharacterized protein LOC119552717 isoform X1 [Drosophila subpulchrella]